jgi:hypothetical protein
MTRRCSVGSRLMASRRRRDSRSSVRLTLAWKRWRRSSVWRRTSWRMSGLDKIEAAHHLVAGGSDVVVVLISVDELVDLPSASELGRAGPAGAQAGLWPAHVAAPLGGARGMWLGSPPRRSEDAYNTRASRSGCDLRRWAGDVRRRGGGHHDRVGVDVRLARGSCAGGDGRRAVRGRGVRAAAPAVRALRNTAHRVGCRVVPDDPRGVAGRASLLSCS